MKLLTIKTYKENVDDYGQGSSFIINLAHVVYIQPDYPYYLLVMTSGSFYINKREVDRIANEMMDAI